MTAALRLLAHAPLALDLRLSSGLLALGAVDRELGVVLLSGARPANTSLGSVAPVSDPGSLLRLVEMRGPNVPAALVELIGPLRAGQAG